MSAAIKKFSSVDKTAKSRVERVPPIVEPPELDPSEVDPSEETPRRDPPESDPPQVDPPKEQSGRHAKS